MMLWNEMANQGWLSGGRMLNEWRDPEYAMPGYQANPQQPFNSLAPFKNPMENIPTGPQTNPYQIGYEQAKPVAMTQQPQNGLAKLMGSAYSGPQNRSMWQGYKPMTRPAYRFGG